LNASLKWAILIIAAASYRHAEWRHLSRVDAWTPERQSLGLLLSRLARLGFGQIYVSRPLPYGHRGPAEQQNRHADENESRKEITPAHIMRPEQGLGPVWKAARETR
jgi:hypothetical protein